MSYLHRAWESAMAGWTAGVSTWRGTESAIERNVDWDAYSARLKRYEVNELYYANLQYDRVNRYLALLRRAGALYTHTRGIYNPVYRMVNIYADKMYPGTIDFETLETGAIPVIADDAIVTALIQLFRWSNWNDEKQLYVRQTEKYGDGYLMVVDDVEGKRVVLEFVEPHKVKYVKRDPAGNVDEIWFEYPDQDDDHPAIYNEPAPNVKKYTTTMILTKADTKIYHDGKLFDTIENVYGFVAVVSVKPHNEGKSYGATRWNVVKGKIDEINSQAALLNDQIRKAIIPYWKVLNGELEAEDIHRDANNIDEILTISLEEGMDVVPLVSNIDIEPVTANILKQLDEVERDLPELLLYRLYDSGSAAPSGVALQRMFDLSVTKLSTAMGTYDDALMRACQMAISIGGLGRYTGFEPFNLQSFNAGNLNFTIRPRDVFYKGIDTEKRIDVLLQTDAPSEAVWELLLVKPEDQVRWRTMADERAKEAALIAGHAEDVKAESEEKKPASVNE